MVVAEIQWTKRRKRKEGKGLAGYVQCSATATDITTINTSNTIN